MLKIPPSFKDCPSTLSGVSIWKFFAKLGYICSYEAKLIIQCRRLLIIWCHTYPNISWSNSSYPWYIATRWNSNKTTQNPNHFQFFFNEFWPIQVSLGNFLIAAVSCIIITFHYHVSLSCIDIIHHYLHLHVPLSCIIFVFNYLIRWSCIMITYHYHVSLSCIIIIYHYPGLLCCIPHVPSLCAIIMYHHHVSLPWTIILYHHLVSLSCTIILYRCHV